MQLLLCTLLYLFTSAAVLSANTQTYMYMCTHSSNRYLYVLRCWLLTHTHTQYPTGMSHQVLVFFTVTLGRIERPILHHVTIHQPILVGTHTTYACQDF